MEEQTTKPRPPNSNMRACHIEPLPPWSAARTTLTVSEVPVWLRKMYNIRISSVAVYRWIHAGNPSKANRDRNIFLKAKKVGRTIMVDKADILAFMDAI